MTGPLLILGPQRPAPDLPRALAAHGVSGPIAVITAGWRHDEDELDALRRDLPHHKLVHLPIYQWFDEVHAEEPVLAAAYNERQRRIPQYKAAYRAQPGDALAALGANSPNPYPSEGRISSGTSGFGSACRSSIITHPVDKSFAFRNCK